MAAKILASSSLNVAPGNGKRRNHQTLEAASHALQKIDKKLCQCDWGVAIFAERNNKHFWVGLNFWREGEWLVHSPQKSEYRTILYSFQKLIFENLNWFSNPPGACQTWQTLGHFGPPSWSAEICEICDKESMKDFFRCPFCID